MQIMGRVKLFSVYSSMGRVTVTVVGTRLTPGMERRATVRCKVLLPFFTSMNWVNTSCKVSSTTAEA